MCEIQDNDKAEIQKYRELLQSLQQKTQESYDKTVMTLSGGALAIAFTVTKELLGENADNPILLIVACISWSVSCCSVMFSYATSQSALENTIKDLDSNKTLGDYSQFTRFLNFTAGLGFFIGVLFFTFFITQNMNNLGLK